MGKVIFRVLVSWPGPPPVPTRMTPGEAPPGAEAGALPSGRQHRQQQHRSLIVSLATAAAKLSVGGFFLAPWVGVFFLHSLEGWGALGKGSAHHFLRTPTPGLGSMGSPGHWEPVAEQARPDQARD